MNQDLTTGKPGAVLRKFCLPLFGSIIFQQLYNIADSFVAGKFIDNNALAAVGNGYEITLIFIAFAFGCNIGCSVLVSQLFGARQHRDMKTAVHTTLIASGVLCAVLMLVGFLCTDSLLRLIQTPEEILEDSRLYLNIYILGLPFVFYYNVATGIFSALGDSRTPFIFLACSSLSNIGADILFVTAFGMKVDGVAWATFLCQGVSCVLAIIFVLRRFRRFETPEKAPVFSWRLLGRIATVAIPSILQQSFISVGNIVIQSVINGFGTATIAGYSASVKLNNLVITSLTTLGNGVSNFTAQNLGAGKYERIRAGFRAGVRLVWCVCAPLVALYLRAMLVGTVCVHGLAHRRGDGRRGALPAHPLAVLLCRVSQNHCGQCPARCRAHEGVRHCDLHRPYPARGAGGSAVPDVARLHGHLAGVAHRLVHRSRAVADLLPYHAL